MPPDFPESELASLCEFRAKAAEVRAGHCRELVDHEYSDAGQTGRLAISDLEAALRKIAERQNPECDCALIARKALMGVP